MGVTEGASGRVSTAVATGTTMQKSWKTRVSPEHISKRGASQTVRQEEMGGSELGKGPPNPTAAM